MRRSTALWLEQPDESLPFGAGKTNRSKNLVEYLLLRDEGVLLQRAGTVDQGQLVEYLLLRDEGVLLQGQISSKIDACGIPPPSG